MEGEGQGVSGHRETFLREQGEVCALLPAVLQEGGHICLVLGGGDLQSVRHGGRGETEAVVRLEKWRKVDCVHKGRFGHDRKGIGEHYT